MIIGETVHFRFNFLNRNIKRQKTNIIVQQQRSDEIRLKLKPQAPMERILRMRNFSSQIRFCKALIMEHIIHPERKITSDEFLLKQQQNFTLYTPDHTAVFITTHSSHCYGRSQQHYVKCAELLLLLIEKKKKKKKHVMLMKCQYISHQKQENV